MTEPSSVPPLPPARLLCSVRLPLPKAEGAICTAFEGLVDGRKDHVALSFPTRTADVLLVRVHSECLTGDVFGSLRCDCGPQLEEAVMRCATEGGLIIYLRQEGRGIGIAAKLAAYTLQDQGLDTFAANRALGHAADERDYRVAAQMLTALGVRRIRLLSNNPDKMDQLVRHGIEVVALERTGVHATSHNGGYLAAMRNYAGHLL
jgi:GTP cyclohydrolase II